MASPALDLLLRYQDDPSLDPLMEDVKPGASQSVLDTIRRGRLMGGRMAPTRAGRMNELDKFLSYRERFEKQQQMRSSGMLTPGSHEDLNFFNDLNVMGPRHASTNKAELDALRMGMPRMNRFAPPRITSPTLRGGSALNRRMP